MKFHLLATVSTNDAAAIFPKLKEYFGEGGTVEPVGAVDPSSRSKGEFRVEAVMVGENSKELNRVLLSTLRKVEKKTRLRAAWSSGGIVEQYFDYVLKKRASDK